MKSLFFFFLPLLFTLAQRLLSELDSQDGDHEKAGVNTLSHIVVLQDDQNPDIVIAALDIVHVTSKVYRHALKAFAGSYDDATLKILHTHHAVAYVEDNKPLQRQSVQNNAGYGLAMLSRSPNIPILKDQYFYRPGGGKGVTVYILDTGINTDHEDFGGRAYMAYNATNTNFAPCMHGTHVAGIAGGRIHGIAKEVSIAGVQVLSCGGYGDATSVLEGLDWVVSNCTGKCVINMSLGTGPNPSDGTRSIADAVKQAVLSNIVTVVSAGNSEGDACAAAPASVGMVITVGAVNSRYVREISNYGKCVDLFAPGINILSSSGRSNNGSVRMSGTSMSAPHVSGLAAYFLSFLPSHSNATSPSLVTAMMKKYSLTGLLRSIGDSPNLLANNGWFNGFGEDMNDTAAW